MVLQVLLLHPGVQYLLNSVEKQASCMGFLILLEGYIIGPKGRTRQGKKKNKNLIIFIFFKVK